MGEKVLDGQDDVDRRAHLGNAVRQACGAHSNTKARTQEMVQGFVSAGGLYAIRAEAQRATVQDQRRGCGEVFDARLDAKHVREEAAQTLPRAKPGWKNA